MRFESQQRHEKLMKFYNNGMKMKWKFKEIKCQFPLGAEFTYVLQIIQILFIPVISLHPKHELMSLRELGFRISNQSYHVCRLKPMKMNGLLDVKYKFSKFRVSESSAWHFFLGKFESTSLSNKYKLEGLLLMKLKGTGITYLLE